MRGIEQYACHRRIKKYAGGLQINSAIIYGCYENYGKGFVLNVTEGGLK
jgi:hypothetical protein